MTSQFVTNISIRDLVPLDVDRQYVTDIYAQLREIFASKLSQDVADFFAEPATEDRITYLWYTERQGEVVNANTLNQQELRKLVDQANRVIAQVEGLAKQQERELGNLSKALLCSTVRPENWDDYLFSVGGKPVLVCWGMRGKDEPGTGGPIDLGDEITTHPLPPIEARTYSPLSLWWIVFLVLSSGIFIRLVDGCAFFPFFGGVPNYCRVDDAKAVSEISLLLEEQTQLQKELFDLGDRVIASPLCGTDTPAYVLKPDATLAESSENGEKTQTLPNESSVNIPSDEQRNDGASVSDASENVQLNDLVRNSGGSACEGLEVFAVWSDPVDVDLVVYCPVDALPDDNVPSERTIGPHNLQACGGQYDLESDGTVTAGPYLERICLGNAAEEGDYLAGAFYDGNNGSTRATEVRLVARGAGKKEVIQIKINPGEEAEDFLAFTIDP